MMLHLPRLYSWGDSMLPCTCWQLCAIMMPSSHSSGYWLLDVRKKYLCDRGHCWCIEDTGGVIRPLLWNKGRSAHQLPQLSKTTASSGLVGWTNQCFFFFAVFFKFWQWAANLRSPNPNFAFTVCFFSPSRRLHSLLWNICWRVQCLWRHNKSKEVAEPWSSKPSARFGTSIFKRKKYVFRIYIEEKN